MLGREAVVFQKRGHCNRRSTNRSDGSANLNQYKTKQEKQCSSGGCLYP